jgi:hypothetical protein
LLVEMRSRITVNQLPPPRLPDRFAAAAEMLRDYFLVGLPPAHPHVVEPPEPVVSSVVFVVTSVLRPARPVIAYGRPRSVFDGDERLRQTLETIESIRRHAPEAPIVLVEASAVSDGEWKELAALVERPLRLDHDRRAVRLRDGLSKAAGEAYMLLAVQPLLEASSYDLAIKVSGRYRLSESFDLDRLPRDRIALRRFTLPAPNRRARGPRPEHRILTSPRRYANTHGTRLYSVPKQLREVWERQLRRALRAGLRGHPMEVTLVRGLPKETYVSLERIGLTGELAISGVTVDD